MVPLVVLLVVPFTGLVVLPVELVVPLVGLVVLVVELVVPFVGLVVLVVELVVPLVGLVVLLVELLVPLAGLVVFVVEFVVPLAGLVVLVVLFVVPAGQKDFDDLFPMDGGLRLMLPMHPSHRIGAGDWSPLFPLALDLSLGESSGLVSVGGWLVAAGSCNVVHGVGCCCRWCYGVMAISNK